MPHIRSHAFGSSPCISLCFSLCIAAAVLAFDAPAASAGKIKMVFPGPVTTFSLPYLVAQKTKTALAIPVTTELAEAINAAAPSEHVTFLINERGGSFTAKRFGQWFTDQCVRIGLRGQPHGLRKAACRRLAEAGCTAPEIAAISGHKSLNEVQRYIEKADRARLARNAVAKTRMATSSV